MSFREALKKSPLTFLKTSPGLLCNSLSENARFSNSLNKYPSPALARASWALARGLLFQRLFDNTPCFHKFKKNDSLFKEFSKWAPGQLSKMSRTHYFKLSPFSKGRESPHHRRFFSEACDMGDKCNTHKT